MIFQASSTGVMESYNIMQEYRSDTFVSVQLTFAGSLGRRLNSRPCGLVFKQLPRDPANVNA